MAETAVSLRGRTRTVDEMGAVYHLLTEKIRASRETPGDGKSEEIGSLIMTTVSTA
jgi:hypothetical protein